MARSTSTSWSISAGLLAFETIALSAFDRFLEQNARYFSPGCRQPRPSWTTTI